VGWYVQVRSGVRYGLPSGASFISCFLLSPPKSRNVSPPPLLHPFSSSQPCLLVRVHVLLYSVLLAFVVSLNYRSFTELVVGRVLRGLLFLCACSPCLFALLSWQAHAHRKTHLLFLSLSSPFGFYSRVCVRECVRVFVCACVCSVCVWHWGAASWRDSSFSYGGRRENTTQTATSTQ
jgi:MFS family permease